MNSSPGHLRFPTLRYMPPIAQLDAVAVTIGPGLSLCLRVGVAKARQIARDHQLPIVHCHHMEGHALVARLPSDASRLAMYSQAVDCTPGVSGGRGKDGSCEGGKPGAPSISSASLSPSNATPSTEKLTGPSHESDSAKSDKVTDGSNPLMIDGTLFTDPSVPFPFLCLLVSGGHNLLLLVRGVGQYVQLGSTLDDALGEEGTSCWPIQFMHRHSDLCCLWTACLTGEAYDKIARLLGLDLTPNGGAALEAFARQGNPQVSCGCPTG